VFKEGIAKFLKLDNLMENLTGYVETRIEILKYDLKEDLARILSKTSVFMAMLFTGMFFLFFLSTAIAMEIGSHLGYFGGFAIVSGFYIILGAILFLNRESVASKVEKEIKGIIKQKKK
jgi:hypothetical protein